MKSGYSRKGQAKERHTHRRRCRVVIVRGSRIGMGWRKRGNPDELLLEGLAASEERVGVLHESKVWVREACLWAK